jgi:transposase, IS6 family
MQAFRYRRFAALVILQCLRWYSKYMVSYRQLAERGVSVDASTIWRWVQRYAPQLSNPAWRVDETCIRVKGEWKWLFGR